MPRRALAPQASASANSATRALCPGSRIAAPEAGPTLAPRACVEVRWPAPEGQDGGMNASSDSSPHTSAAQAEVASLCQELIRIESVNFGDGSGPGERAAAEYVASKLSEVGLDVGIYESEPGRASAVARIPGADSSRGALLIHGHIDVVPAFADQWTLPPFAGEIRDGCIWGRGAVDMKDTDAMVLAVIRQWMREGTVPPRDIVLAFVADEEAGGKYGARYLVDNHADLFEGCTEAISEVGGFSLTVAGKRLYAIETAQKGMAWMRLTAHGRAGHGSMIAEDNAVTALCEAVARLGAHQFPIRMTKTMQAFLDEIADLFGITLDPDDMEATIAQLGSMARMIGATLRNTANPTMLTAGYKTNVIPGEAHAIVDGRFLPGYEDEFLEQVKEIVGEKIEIEMMHHDKALETTFDGALVDAMVAA